MKRNEWIQKKEKKKITGKRSKKKNAWKLIK